MRALRALVGPIFVVAGALHFQRTAWYEAIMPDYLPAHRALVYASGAAEMAGGAGLMMHAPRPPGGWCLIPTLSPISPATVGMSRPPEPYRAPGGRATLLAPLPLQAV